MPAGSIEQRRRAFADSKIALGTDEIRRRLARDIRLTDLGASLMTRLSGGRRATSICEIHVTGGNAADFVAWFDDTARADYAYSMLAANPDHFLIQADPSGRLEVIETTGGMPAATRFFVDYQDTSTLTTADDPTLPVKAAGVAISGAGKVIGGIRHQFRDEPGGFYARLCVEFPRVTPPSAIAAHRWHLACEFSNWIAFGLDAVG